MQFWPNVIASTHIDCYVSSLASGQYSKCFGIPACPRHVSDEVRKQTKIYILSYLLDLARKGCLMGKNKKKGIDNRLRNYCTKIMYQNG